MMPRGEQFDTIGFDADDTLWRSEDYFTIAEQFFVEGSGNTVRFEPSSDRGGRYSYSGNMSGFAVYGHGTYTVNTDGDTATGIVATGPGSVKTPMGTQTAVGTEKYTLTPLPDGCPAEG